MTRRNDGRINWVGIGSFVLCMALVWWFILPPQLGGRTTAFMTKGISMEPYIHDGDLAILHKQSDYKVGDVIAYKADALGTVLLHRIVQVDGNGRYITQGDNNENLDLDHPTKRQVIGKMDHLVQGGAQYVGFITSWPVRLIGILLIAWAFYGFLRSFPRRDETDTVEPTFRDRTAGWISMAKDLGRTAGKGAGGATPPSAFVADPIVTTDVSRAVQAPADRRLTMLSYLFSGAALLSAFIAVFALMKPASTTFDRQITYKINGEWKYSATGGPGSDLIYENSELKTGDPIYLSLIDELNLTYAIKLDSKANFHGTGSVEMDVLIKGKSGWTNTLPLLAKTEFDGNEYRLNTTVDLNHIKTINAEAQRLTRMADQSFMLSLTPRVHFAGDFDGADFSKDLNSSLNFKVNDKMMVADEVKATEAPAEDAPSFVKEQAASKEVLTGLNPSTGGTLSVPAGTLTKLALGGKPVEVSDLRYKSLTALAIAGLGFLATTAIRRRRSPQAAEDVSHEALSHFREMVVPQPTTPATAPPVEVVAQEIRSVDSIDELSALAEEFGELVRHERTASGDAWYVESEGVMYRYHPTGTAAERFGVPAASDLGAQA